MKEGPVKRERAIVAHHQAAEVTEPREGASHLPPSAIATQRPTAMWRRLLLILALSLAARTGWAQGGPPFYTNDPGTPGNHHWEINLGYMPFFYSDQSASHIPDVDLNFGIGERIQLTYENA
jgi:hypothetical protein